MPPRCSAEDLGGVDARRSRRATAGRRLRSLGYSAAPSVATVITRSSSGPRPSSLAVLIAASDVADRRQPEVPKRADDVVGDAPASELEPAVVGVEQHVELVGRAIADRRDDVGVHHVVDQRDVLVADALDVVLAEPVLAASSGTRAPRRRRSACRAAPSGGRRRRSCRPTRWRRRRRPARSSGCAAATRTRASARPVNR